MTVVINRRRRRIGAIVAQCEGLVNIPNIVPFETFVCKEILTTDMDFKGGGDPIMNFAPGNEVMEFKGV